MPTDTAWPEWMPCHAVAGRACGYWWDAVELPAAVAEPVRRRLRTAPAIADDLAHVVHWLIPVDAAAGWDAPAVTILGAGRQITIPPPGGGAAARWLVPPSGDCLADPHALYAALRAAYSAGSGARRA